MIRQFLVIAFVMVLGWLLRRIFGGAALRSGPGSAPEGGRSVPEKSGAEMVRDRVCNTFLPRSSAISSEVAGERHYFCSERCRQTFLKRP